MIYTKNTWKQTIEAMHSGREIEVDAEVFYYFLEVLPPAGMPWNAKFSDGTERKGCSFGFAEGAEEVVAFWMRKIDGIVHYFCRQTTQMNPWR